MEGMEEIGIEKHQQRAWMPSLIQGQSHRDLGISSALLVDLVAMGMLLPSWG